MRCARCSFENDPTSTYCERCGTPLQMSPSFTQAQTEYAAPLPPPPPPDYNAPPAFSSQGQANRFPQQNRVPPRSKITVFRVLRGIFYFLATFISAVGVLGAMEYLIGVSSGGGVVGLVLGLCVLVGGIIMFRSMRHRIPQLRWWQYLLALLAATGVLILALTSPALTSHGRLPYFLIGVVILLYGVAIAAFSLW